MVEHYSSDGYNPLIRHTNSLGLREGKTPAPIAKAGLRITLF